MTVISLVAYLATLAPTVTSEDSGELIAAAHCWGVPHPPGYPLWTILCGIVIRVFQLGCIAWRANLFSALCAAISAGLLCRCAMDLGIRSSAAVACSLVMAFGSNVWSQSVITEVYTLHLLLFSTLLLCMVRWMQSQSPQWLVIGSLMVGLGMSNHHLFGLSTVGFLAWALIWRPRLLKRWPLAIMCASCFILGLLPYLYLPMSARSDPPMNWGDPRTATSFLAHIERHQYGRPASSSVPDDHKSILQYVYEQEVIAGFFLSEPTPPLIPFAILGAGYALLRRKALAAMLLSVTVAHTLCFSFVHGIGHERADIWASKVFFLPQYMLISLCAGLGIEALFLMFNRDEARRAIAPHPAAKAVGLWPCALPLVPLFWHWRDNDMHDYWYAYDHAVNILNSTLPDAMIFPSGDHNTFPLIYLTQVEHQRTDVVVADKYGYIEPGLYADMPDFQGRRPDSQQERDAIESWVIRHAHRPVYYTVKKDPLVSNATIIPVGVLYHLLPDRKSIDSDAPWSHIEYRNLTVQHPCTPDYGALNILADYEFFRGLYAMERRDRDEGIVHFSRSADYGKEIKEVYNNIGSALAEYGLTAEALTYFERAAQLAPDYTVSRWNQVKVLKSRGDLADAEAALLKISAADPRDFRAFGELGFIGMRLGRPEDQVKRWFYESLKLHPEQPQIISQLAQIYANPPTATPPAASATVDRDRNADRAAAPSMSPPSPSSTPLASSFANGGAVQQTATDGPLVFDHVSWDAGRVASDELVEHQFPFINAGESELKILHLDANSPCLVPTLESYRVPSGASSIVKVVFDASQAPSGPSRQQVFIATADQHQPTMVLTVTAEVATEYICEPAAIVCTGPRPRDVIATTLSLHHQTSQPFAIHAVQCALAGVQGRPESDVPDSSHVIDVVLDPAQLPIQWSGTLRIVTDVATGRVVNVPVRIAFDPEPPSP